MGVPACPGQSGRHCYSPLVAGHRPRTQRYTIGQPPTSAGRLPRIAVAGPGGFIGSAIVSWAEANGQRLCPVPRFRIKSLTDAEASAAAETWPHEHPEVYRTLCASLEGFDVVVNAAGVAEPESARTEHLLAGNAVHAAVLARAARDAGVRRFVHVSSAVVQGRLDPLDESPRQSPLSPYGLSKAEGERLLLDGARHAPSEVVVYRPTSVQSPCRQTTRQLARLAALPVFPVVAGGDQPLPVALADNVAAGILFAATMPASPAIVLQPWEGITTRLLVEFLAAPHIVSLPPATARVSYRFLRRVTSRSARLTSLARRLELVLRGQGIDARNLAAAGFVPPVGHEGWLELGQRLSGHPDRRSVPTSAIGQKAG